VTRPNFGRLGQHYGEVYRPREEDAAKRIATQEQLNALLWVFHVRNMRRRDANAKRTAPVHIP
jgi:hypothetical protein